jgi:hypothetical protein
MSTNWINALDNCAASGVLDFDAAAWLLDQPQRFVGNPGMESLPPIRQPLLLPPGIKMQGQLNQDQFNSESGFIKNPTWKKVLFGALAIGGTIAGVFALKKFKIGSKCKNVGDIFKTIARKTWHAIKAPFVWVAKKFKGKKP